MLNDGRFQGEGELVVGDNLVFRGNFANDSI